MFCSYEMKLLGFNVPVSLKIKNNLYFKVSREVDMFIIGGLENKSQICVTMR